MTILGFDTSGTDLSVGVVTDDHIIVADPLEASPGHVESLVPTIEALLESSDLSIRDLDAVACMKGPGSFTGLRIGLSTAKGISLGAHIPAVGVPTLEAIARSASPTEMGRVGDEVRYIPLLDARKRRFYAALFEWSRGEVRRLSEDLDIPMEEVLTLGSNRRAILCGSGVSVLLSRTDLPENLTPRESRPIDGLLMLAGEHLARGEVLKDSDGPFYLRTGDIGSRKKTYRFSES